jgi:hypothetical protein
MPSDSVPRGDSALLSVRRLPFPELTPYARHGGVEHPEPVSNRAYQSLWELCDQSRSIAGTLGAAPGAFIIVGLDVIRFKKAAFALRFIGSL